MEFERALAVNVLGCFLCYMTMALFSDIHSSPLPNNLVFMLVGVVTSIGLSSREVLARSRSYGKLGIRGKRPLAGGEKAPVVCASGP
jgi:hypothetical protein